MKWMMASVASLALIWNFWPEPSVIKVNSKKITQQLKSNPMLDIHLKAPEKTYNLKAPTRKLGKVFAQNDYEENEKKFITDNSSFNRADNNFSRNYNDEIPFDYENFQDRDPIRNVNENVVFEDRFQNARPNDSYSQPKPQEEVIDKQETSSGGGMIVTPPITNSDSFNSPTNNRGPNNRHVPLLFKNNQDAFYLNQSNSNWLLVVENKTSASIVSIEQKKTIYSLKISNEDCYLVSSSMVHVLYFDNYLLSTTTLCSINLKKKTIDKVNDFVLPLNAFSMAYWKSFKNNHWVLINGKPWDSSGYLILLKIGLRKSATEQITLFNNLSGYSGAIGFNENKSKFYLTLYEGKSFVYEIPTTIMAKFSYLQGVSFQLEKYLKGSFQGYSSSLYVKEPNLYYDNDEEKSWIFNLNSAESKLFKPECDYLGRKDNFALMACDNNKITFNHSPN